MDRLPDGPDDCLHDCLHDCFLGRSPYLRNRFISSARWGPVIESPCNRVCTLDPASGLCLGCGRSLDEIARWTQMTDAERERVVAERDRRPTSRRQPAL